MSAPSSLPPSDEEEEDAPLPNHVSLPSHAEMPMRPLSVVSLGTESESLATENSNFVALRDNISSGLTVGDYDMKKSPSTAAFMNQIVEDRFLNRTRQRLIPRLEGLAEEGPEPSHRSRVATALLVSACDALMEGIDSISDDDFLKCFEKQTPPAWNWNWFLWPMWAVGGVIRYFILFPLRCALLLLGWIVFGSSMILIQLVLFRGPTREHLLRLCITSMSAVFVMTWGGRVRYHGHLPSANAKSNIVFVANHTSLIDVIILQQVRCFSLVGQRHKGMVRFLQDKVLGSLQCIWFDRAQMKDRAIVQKKLTQHAKDPTRNPLLVFPEGTCVNNRYVIMFKKGAFELGVPVCPVAIRYEKTFVDPFWSSRDQSFLMHLVELMTSWCLICDVYFMEPTVRRDGESAEAFALRVRNQIAEKAEIKAVDWDGYLKHFMPSARLLAESKQVYADAFHQVLNDATQAQRNADLMHGGGDDDDFYFGTSPSTSLDGNKHSPTRLHPALSTSSQMSAGSGFRPRLGPVVLSGGVGKMGVAAGRLH